MNHKFGSRLQQVRRSRHLFQRDLEGALNLGPGTISQYERGRREPGFDLLLAVADYLDLSVDFLLGRSASSPESPLLAMSRFTLRAEFGTRPAPEHLPEALSKAVQIESSLFSVERIARRSGLTQAALLSVMQGNYSGLSGQEIQRLAEDLGLTDHPKAHQL